MTKDFYLKVWGLFFIGSVGLIRSVEVDIGGGRIFFCHGGFRIECGRL